MPPEGQGDGPLSFSRSTTEMPMRRDTGSTTSSFGEPVPIPPGFYTIPVHGNCPRCHHRHEAATINVRISGNTSQATYVNCDNCHERWLAFGAGGSTISLLSTKTVEPDVVEQDFRRALFNMVRSVSSIGSTTALASVPEVPSRVPSQHSTRSRPTERDHTSSHTTDTDMHAARYTQQNQASTPNGRGEEHDAPHDSGRSNRNHRLRNTKANLHRLKTRLKNQLVQLRKFRLGQVALYTRKRKASSKAKGKLPVLQVDMPINEISGASSDSKVDAVLITQARDINPGTADPHANTAPGAAHTRQFIPKTLVEKELLLKMSKEQRLAQFQEQFSQFRELLKGKSNQERIEWVREQFTDFKRQYPFQQQRRHTHGSLAPSHTDGVEEDGSLLPPPHPSPQSPPQRPERRYSEDLHLIGSHMHSFSAGELFYELRPFSIESSTRLSETTTVVNSDGLTVTSGAPSLDVNGYNQRHHSRSPRPRSVQTSRSRLRHSVGPEDLAGRPSMDSMNSTVAVRSLTGVGSQMDRYSIGSNTFMPPPTPTAPSFALVSSAPYLNGNRTSDEIRSAYNRQSSSTTSTP